MLCLWFGTSLIATQLVHAGDLRTDVETGDLKVRGSGVDVRIGTIEVRKSRRGIRSEQTSVSPTQSTDTKASSVVPRNTDSVRSQREYGSEGEPVRAFEKHNLIDGRTRTSTPAYVLDRDLPADATIEQLDGYGSRNGTTALAALAERLTKSIQRIQVYADNAGNPERAFIIVNQDAWVQLSESERARGLSFIADYLGVRSIRTDADSISRAFLDPVILNILREKGVHGMIDEAVGAFVEEGFSEDEAEQLASFVLDVVPIVGDAKGVAQTVTGKDIITGERLRRWEEAAFTAVGIASYAGGPVTKGAAAGVLGAAAQPQVLRNGDDAAKRFYAALANMKRGYLFEKEIKVLRLPGYRTQVRLVDNLGLRPYRNLDGYLPDVGIFSLKATQLADHNFAYNKGLIDELVAKYRPGTMFKGTTSGDNAGQFKIGNRLEGEMYLVVPDQQRGIPHDILQYAELRAVSIITKSEFVDGFSVH